MQVVAIPVGWDAIRGQPEGHYIAQLPPTEILLSDTFIERQLRIWSPLRVMVDLAVTAAMKVLHDADEAKYHQARPAHKACPFDQACRFV